MEKFTHWQFVVESFNFDDQAVLTGHQLVLQLRHFSLIGRLGQVVAQDVDHQIKQHDTGGRQEDKRNAKKKIITIIKNKKLRG